MFGGEAVSSAEYGFFSRLLHRVALGSPAILRATMQMEQGKWKDEPADDEKLAPVFICGLARSGSTLLLNRLAATGSFSTSTYRHMPFVLAPNMWSGASRRQQKASVSVERAHGDGMTHSFDSEEAFEEVFWRAIGQSRNGIDLLPWNPEYKRSDLQAFRLFMTSVVKAGNAPRYLSKNNNNVTRIPTLLSASQTARLVVPFRDPLGFASSTMAQHRKFQEGHKRNPFDARYMAWLGHHEFGPYFKPFAAPGVVKPVDVTSEYLVAYWVAVYREILTIKDPRLTFFDYEGFCENPVQKLAALGDFLALEQAPKPPDDVHTPNDHGVESISPQILAAATKLHEKLKRRSVGCISARCNFGK